MLPSLKYHLPTRIKQRILLLIFFAKILMIQAQQPSYYTIGAEELAGINIFSILQDEKGMIWMSTDDGVFRYDGYDFIRLKNTEALSYSLFGLTMDNDEKIYCYNLNGQIFSVNNDSLHLHYEVPDSLLSDMLTINFDDQNHLIFRSKSFFKVNSSGYAERILPSYGFSQPMPKTKKGALLLLDYAHQKLVYYRNGKIEVKANSDIAYTYRKDPLAVQRVFLMGASPYITSHKTSEVYQYDDSWQSINFRDAKSKLNQHMDIFPFTDSTLWFASEKKGAYAYQINGKPLYNGVELFPRYRISCFLEDREGNLWLPTLGKGIIIIPNKKWVDYTNHPLLKEDDIRSITASENGTVYVAGLNGAVYRITAQQVTQIEQSDNKIEFLEYVPDHTSLMYNSTLLPLDPGKKSLNYQNPTTHDLTRINSSNYLAATIEGVVLFMLNPIDSSYHHLLSSYKNALKKEDDAVFFPVGRATCLRFDPNKDEIWVGTTAGLKIIKPKGTEQVLFNEQQLIANGIEKIGTEIWVSTSKNGILVFEDQELKKQITTEEGLLSNAITAMQYKGGNFYIVSKEGLQIYNLVSDNFLSIRKSDGLLSNHIIDFTVTDENTIWLVYSQGLQKIDIRAIKKNTVPPIITLDKVLVNGVEHNNDQSGFFTYQQNQIEFHYTAKAYKHRGSLQYFYKLEGLHDQWTALPYNDRNIQFTSLPPGEYTFYVKAANENNIASNTIAYRFSIAAPFWSQWWFLLMCGVLFILLMIIVFVVRLRVLRRRMRIEKQLKAFEVTAIKAQMNPHFIFNALNSIQDLIMLKDFRTSNVYLGKFADLMRKTLEVSGEATISLEKEVEMLTLYLDLEKLRFGDEFTYNIACDLREEQTEKILIPSMLIQPYVENAVKHGLLHKKGKKKLTITFSLTYGILTCTITDNGVGRQRSAAIKQRQQRQYASFASTATKKRIDLINETTDKKIALHITDLGDENKTASGTQVVIRFRVIV